MRVLVLGGTAEAREVAARLQDLGVGVVSSLAGRVSEPRLPVGEVRIGGFGGVDGLVAYLHAERITAVVDATHPFATTITANARRAARITGIELVRYARPGWSARPDASSWHWATSLLHACDLAARLGGRPFLTTGRQTLSAFEGWSDRQVLVRLVEPPVDRLPERWTVLLDRGPYDEAGELRLMTRHRVDVLVTKDSGGDYTAAKLDAAAVLGVPVVVVARPAVPAGVRAFDTVGACVAAVLVPRSRQHRPGVKGVDDGPDDGHRRGA